MFALYLIIKLFSPFPSPVCTAPPPHVPGGGTLLRRRDCKGERRGGRNSSDGGRPFFNRTVAAAAGREFAFVKTYGYPETSHLLFDEKPQQREHKCRFHVINI